MRFPFKLTSNEYTPPVRAVRSLTVKVSSVGVCALMASGRQRTADKSSRVFLMSCRISRIICVIVFFGFMCYGHLGGSICCGRMCLPVVHIWFFSVFTVIRGVCHLMPLPSLTYCSLPLHPPLMALMCLMFGYKKDVGTCPYSSNIWYRQTPSRK